MTTTNVHYTNKLLEYFLFTLSIRAYLSKNQLSISVIFLLSLFIMALMAAFHDILQFSWSNIGLQKKLLPISCPDLTGILQ